MTGSGGNIWAGALAGYAASRTMDQVTTWFLASQSDESRRKEAELAPGGALVVAGKQVGAAVGRSPTDEQAGRVGLALHRTFGMGYGMAASVLIRRGTPPLAAGMTVGGLAWALVDEGTALGQFTEYPLESHLRGIVGHAAFGLTAGVLLSLVEGR